MATKVRSVRFRPTRNWDGSIRKNSAKDLTGQRFGSWVCVSYCGYGKWNCRCDCGNAKVVQDYQLIHGISSGCTPCRGARQRRANVLEIIALRKRGLTLEAIGELCGVTPERVRQLLKANGITGVRQAG